MTKKVPGARRGRPPKNQSQEDLLQDLKGAMAPGQKEKDDAILAERDKAKKQDKK